MDKILLKSLNIHSIGKIDIHNIFFISVVSSNSFEKLFGDKEKLDFNWNPSKNHSHALGFWITDIYK